MTQQPLTPDLAKLTPRQKLALDAIRYAGWDGISSYDLGCALGGSTHWAATAGVEVGKALRRKGLVQQRRRGERMVWTVAGALERPGAPHPGELPEGF